MTDAEITELLFVREEPISANLAIVFAASSEIDLERRVRRGVELWRAGFVPKLLMTGGGVLATTKPESKRMVEIARELGVPAADLLVENRSANTFDNVRFSRTVLENAGLLARLSTVILVSSEWQLRRVLLTMRKYFPEPIRWVCCPTLEGFDRGNWTQSAAGRAEVEAEAVPLESFLLAGSLSLGSGRPSPVLISWPVV